MSSKPAKVLARGWRFEVQQDAGYFLPIMGVNSFTPNRTIIIADATDFNSPPGTEEHSPAIRGLTVSIQGYRLEGVDGERDPGQARVEQLDTVVDCDALTRFRMWSPAGRGYEFDASYNVTPSGGGTTDNTAWSVEVTKTGPVGCVTTFLDGGLVVDGNMPLDGSMAVDGNANPLDFFADLLGTAIGECG